jgi:hypothetical protein
MIFITHLRAVSVLRQDVEVLVPKDEPNLDATRQSTLAARRRDVNELLGG